MSVMHPDGRPAELPARSTPLSLVAEERDYGGRNHARLKRLAALHLHTLIGWPVEMIAGAFGHSPTTVRRQVEQCRAELLAALQRKEEPRP